MAHRCSVMFGIIYRSGTVNSNTVNSKFHLIRISNICQIPIITACKQSLEQGNTFTPVCHTVHWGVPGPVEGAWSWGVCSQGGALARVGAWSHGGLLPGGLLPGEGVPGLGRGGVWWRPPQTATAAGGMNPKWKAFLFHV